MLHMMSWIRIIGIRREIHMTKKNCIEIFKRVLFPHFDKYILQFCQQYKKRTKSKLFNDCPLKISIKQNGNLRAVISNLLGAAPSPIRNDFVLGLLSVWEIEELDKFLWEKIPQDKPFELSDSNFFNELKALDKEADFPVLPLLVVSYVWANAIRNGLDEDEELRKILELCKQDEFCGKAIESFSTPTFVVRAKDKKKIKKNPEQHKEEMPARVDLTTEEEISESGVSDGEISTTEENQTTAVEKLALSDTTPTLISGSEDAEKDLKQRGVSGENIDIEELKSLISTQLNLPKLDEVRREFSFSEEPQSFPTLESNKNRYLGYVRRMGNYWNFHITGEFIGKAFYPIRAVDANTDFPKYGAVNLASLNGARLSEGAFYVLDFDKNDLTDNFDTTIGAVRTDYTKRLDLETLINEKRFHKAEDFFGYIVVTPSGEESIDFSNSTIYVSPLGDNSFLHLGRIPVLLKVDTHLFGPFTLSANRNNMLYVNVKLVQNQGIIDGYELPENTSPYRFTQFCWDGEQSNPESVEFIVVDQLKRLRYDAWSHEKLLEEISKLVSTDSLARQNMLDWAQNNVHSFDFFTQDELVRKERCERVLALLTTANTNERFYKSLSSLVARSFDAENANQDLLDAVVQTVLDNPDHLRRLESYRTVLNKVNDLTLQKEQLDKTIQARLAESDRENKSLTEENSRLTKEIESKRKELENLKSKERDRLENDNKKLLARNVALKQEAEEIEDYLQTSVKNTKQYAFDGFIASKMLDAASQWASDEANKQITSGATNLDKLPVLPHKGKELANYLTERVQQYRKYDQDTVLNLFLTTTQNFLTVFSGAPGSGKTSICNIMANALGLDVVSQLAQEQNIRAMDRYLPISVERGWTSKRDFVGYWNPLTKTFESLDVRRYEAFKQLDAEKKAKIDNLPFMMLLDEANLSPMEYYWADFMNICDSRNRMSSISLGDKSHNLVPDTLRFVATINNDHTTERLSPRLIDRASVITLPEADWDIHQSDAALSPAKGIVSWQSMLELFNAYQPLNDRASETLDYIFSSFDELQTNISPRIKSAVTRHVIAGSRLFSDTHQLPYMTAIDFAVAQKLLPLIDGSGEEYKKGLDNLLTYLNNLELTRSSALLSSILLRGERMMDYYRFF